MEFRHYLVGGQRFLLWRLPGYWCQCATHDLHLWQLELAAPQNQSKLFLLVTATYMATFRIWPPPLGLILAMAHLRQLFFGSYRLGAMVRMDWYSWWKCLGFTRKSFVIPFIQCV